MGDLVERWSQILGRVVLKIAAAYYWSGACGKVKYFQFTVTTVETSASLDAEASLPGTNMI